MIQTSYCFTPWVQYFLLKLHLDVENQTIVLVNMIFHFFHFYCGNRMHWLLFIMQIFNGRWANMTLASLVFFGIIQRIMLFYILDQYFIVMQNYNIKSLQNSSYNLSKAINTYLMYSLVIILLFIKVYALIVHISFLIFIGFLLGFCSLFYHY